MSEARISGDLGREFVKFWLGQSVSMVGNQFTQLALPIAAEVTPPPSGRKLLAEAVEGQTWLWRQPLLRAITLTILINNGGGNITFAVFVLYFVTQVGITPVQLGLIFALGGASSLIGARLSNVNQQSIRQAVTPDRLLGRVQSGVYVLVGVAQVIGSLLGGVIGQVAGLRPAIAVGVIITLTSALPSIFSPLRELREVPTLAP